MIVKGQPHFLVQYIAKSVRLDCPIQGADHDQLGPVRPIPLPLPFTPMFLIEIGNLYPRSFAHCLLPSIPRPGQLLSISAAAYPFTR